MSRSAELRGAPEAGARPARADCGRVLHVLNGLPFGGNETLCLQLLDRLPASERLLLNIGPEGGMREKLEGLPGLRMFAIPYARDARVRFVRSVAALLRELRPDAILVYPFGLHVLVGLAARLAGIRKVLVHAGNPPPEDAARRRLWRWIVRASVLLRIPILSCSRYVDEEFRALSRLMPGRSGIIHNGIDTRAVALRAERARQATHAGPPVVGMTARLSIIKDQETLVRSFVRVARAVPGARLWIVGEGETRPRLERLVQELGLGASVEFLGKRGDVPDLLARLTVYVFSTTRDEGFGIAIVEAMAAGLPVVASDVPACREVMLDGATGILVPPRDPDAMGAAIERLLLDPAVRAEWSARARGSASEFSIERCASRWTSALAGEAP